MRLTLYTDYALRVLMQAALRQPDPATIDEVATAYGVSRNHLVKVVQDLAQHGFLITRRGIGGGFTLGLPAEKICVGDVVRFTEKDEQVIDCVNRANNACRIVPVCRLKGVLAEAAAAFFAVLDRYTVADLVKQKAEMKKLLDVLTLVPPKN